MWINVLVLLIAALAGGLLAFKFRSTKRFPFDLALTFAGAYLFAITIVHVIPELFTASTSPATAGIAASTASLPSLSYMNAAPSKRSVVPFTTFSMSSEPR